MNFKKTIAKSLVVAMALGMVPVANLQTAKAAVTDFKIDGETGIATANDAKYWGVAKLDKGKGKDSVLIGDKYYKITNIKEYVEGGIDAYALLKGKAGILAAGENSVPDSSWVITEIPASDNTFKVYVVAAKDAIKGVKGEKALGGDFGYLLATTGKSSVKEVDLNADSEKIEVKLNDGNWQTLKAFFGNVALATGDDKNVNKKLKLLGQNTSNLSFRYIGEDNKWPSKEVKVKVGLQAKAPNVKVDINKETTTIKKGLQWQVVAKDGAAAADKWKDSENSKGLAFSDLKLNDNGKLLDTADYDILVRTAATKKKVASSPTKITLNKPATGMKVTSNTSTGASIQKSNSETDIYATVEPSLAYDITKGATIKNVSPTDIEYALFTDGLDFTKLKWSTLKASKDPKDKPTKATLKYSALPKNNTWGNDGKTKLFLRLSGTKQDKNNVATRAGVSATAVIAFKNITQTFAIQSATSENASGTIEKKSATEAAVKVATASAVKFVIKAKIDKLVNAKGGTPSLKPIGSIPDGVKIKAGKITDYSTGEFDITLEVTKKAFTGADVSATAKYTLKYEGVETPITITFAKK